MFARRLLAFCGLFVFLPISISAQEPEFRCAQAKWQPDGDYIAFEGRDRIWVLNGELEFVVTLRPEPLPEELTLVDIMDIAWTPDGTRLTATVISSHTELQSTRLIIWDAKSWEMVTEVFNAVGSIVFSPDNRYIATQAGYEVAIFDLDTQTTVNTIPARPLRIAWNPTNINELAIGNPDMVRIANPFTSEIIEELSYSGGYSPAYSPDGRYIALGRHDQNDLPVIDVLDTSDYQVTASLRHENGLPAEIVFWLENGEIGTSSRLNEALRWNAMTGDRVVFNVLDDWSTAFWKPDGSAFVASGYDETNNLYGTFIHDGHTGAIVAQLLQTENQYIRSITLQDADSEAMLSRLGDGHIVDLAEHAAGNLAIRANTRPGVVGSVTFDLNGLVTVDNEEPYTSPLSGAGEYLLTVTPYTGIDGTGTSGIPLTITFTIAGAQ